MSAKFLHNITPYLTIEEDVLIFKDGRLGFFYEVNNISYDNLTEYDILEFTENFTRILESLPINYDLQKIDIYHKGNREIKLDETNLIQKRIKENFEKTEILKQKSYLAFIYNPKRKLKDATSTSINSSIKIRSIKENLKKKREVETTIKETVLMFSSLKKISLNRLRNNDINKLIVSYYNLDFNSNNKLEYPSNNFTINEENLVVGNKKVNIVSFDGQGDFYKVYSNTAYDSTDVPQFFTYPLGYNLNFEHIKIVNYKRISKKSVDNKFLIESAIGEGDFERLGSIFRRAVKVKSAIEQLDMNNDDICLISNHVIVFSENSDELYKNTSTVKACYNEMELYSILETFDTANLYFSNSPGNTETYRDKFMPTSNAAAYFDFQGEYKEDDKGDIFTDRYGFPVMYDTFHKELEKQNGVVVGPTGSGKSYFIASLICSSFFRDEINVLIDKNKTYKNLVEALGGRHIEYDENTPLQFNPFIIDKDEKGKWILKEDETKFFYSFFHFLYYGNEKSKNKHIETSIFDILTTRYYDYENLEKNANKVPCLRRFLEFSEEYIQGNVFYTKQDKEDIELVNQHFDFSHFKLTLRKFTKGIYKNVFTEEETVMLTEEKLICFEMDNIQNDEILYPLITMLIIRLVLDFLNKKKKVVKHLRIDEAWSMFQGEMRDFMEYMYRTIRKMLGEVTIITQSADDLKTSGLKSIIEQNSALIYVLNHKGKSVSSLKENLNLTDHELRIVESLRKEEPKKNLGREFFVKRIGVNYYNYEPNDSRAFRLQLPKVLHCIITSNPKEREAYNDLVKKHNGDVEKSMLEYEETYN